ncbi:ATP-binding protein [Ventrimonas sp. CLA-AP-H27]|uniref:Stage 0 sporulation protein A homolog n=1 Tax=Ventrimonas faecis TaxID=3133170 RepID=A0ABV1HM02_9FIRM
MKKNTGKKLTYVSRVCMTVLTTVLIVLFFCIMSLVGKIQGTARVVNYAGLVRGMTQRMVKLENLQSPQDEMLEEVESIIIGLRYGSDDLNLVRLDDSAFQDKLQELEAYFETLKVEIQLVRENGYENTQIIEKSEQFFRICDEATGLAEAYSQRKATALNQLEQVVFADIAGLLVLIAMEIFKALRYAAQNRILQKKVYLDEATGLPNKNKCEEILDNDTFLEDGETVAVCVFDLNNLRIINNNLGHEKGDEYIRSFAVQLRAAMPAEHFVGRDGGDEFLAVIRGLEREAVEACLSQVRSQTADYSANHPEMPISYAAGYAISSDFESCGMRDLFRQADKNMYVDKNRAKMLEAAEKQNENIRLLDTVKQQGYSFSDCLYCDALLDQYRVLRADSEFFLAEDGSYTGAVEQIVQELARGAERGLLRQKLQPEALKQVLSSTREKLEFPYQCTDGEKVRRGRMTLLFLNNTEDGRLHHFIFGFEPFHDKNQVSANEKVQLTRYYEQMKQSILENGNYVDALMDTAEAVYTVDLTHDRLEKIFYPSGSDEFEIMQQTPCAYNEYCTFRSGFVTEDTMENYRIVDSSEKLLERFRNGAKQVTVEYQETGAKGEPEWLQKTVLMSQDTLYDEKTGREMNVVHGIILFKNTSVFHEQEQKEKERLQVAYEEADLASKAKTEFLNRMSHDIKTPINGVMGMLEIIRRNIDDRERVEECLGKISLSTSHLLALVNDVLDMGRIETKQEAEAREAFDLENLMTETAALVDAQLLETGILHYRHREAIQHTALVGNPLHLRQIMVNLLSNAIKYNKPGGRIDTYAKELSCDGKQAFYEFKITDTGIGMREEFVKNGLFKPFTQEKSDARTQYKGTGLGMSIVKGLVEQMNGCIQVESVEGEGTTFTFQLPFLLDETVHAGQDSDGTAAADVSDMKILLVEDNEINMEIAEFYLTEAGAKTEKAWNGAEAVQKFAESETGSFDVVLMDVMMPVMDGLEATRRIRALGRPDAGTVTILAMTAQSSADSIRQCEQAGMDGYIAKPVEAAELLRILAEKCPQRV